MWNYFIFFSLIFLLKTESYVTHFNKTDHILYKRDNGATLLSEDIDKPENDPFSYRLIQLSNKLKVLLINSQNSQASGAALNVAVGHYSDPDGVPGVAHFCEHLVFMGTQKYPGEDDFSGYLSSHSGSYNAYTSTEETNYFFSVSHEYYEKSLDMFSQFFISALISKSSVEREAHAVDLEHRKNLQNDNWRLFQLEKSVSNKKSPYSKFGTGNYVTLVDNTKKKGLDIASIVHTFYETYYSSNLMTLVLFSPKSLDELQELAIKYFAGVPNKNVQKPVFTEKPFGSDMIGKQFWYKPIAGGRGMQLVFPISTQRAFYNSNPVSFLSYFLEHEVKDSLVYILKKNGWISALKTMNEYIVSEVDAFRIVVELTEKGLEEYENIIELIFAFLKMLRDKGLQEELCQDLIKLEKIYFRFQDSASLISYASSLASAMQEPYVEYSHILRTIYTFEYKPEQVKDLLKQIRHDNYFLLMVSDTKPGVWDMKEPWYDSEYKIESFSSTLLEKTRQITTDVVFQLPEKNIYIPENFFIKKPSTHKTTKPTLMFNSSWIRYWYKEDDTYSSPRTAMYLLIKIPDYSSSPFEAAHSGVYVDMLHDYIMRTYYNAVIAGYDIQMYSVTFGIYLSLYGYSDKILLLFENIIKTIVDFTPTNSSFVASRDRLLDAYSFEQFAPPYSYILSAFTDFRNPLGWSSSDILYALQSTTYNDIRIFHLRRFPSMFSEILAVGVLSNQTHDLLEIDLKKLTKKHQFRNQILPPRSYILKEGSNYIYEMTLPNPSEENSAIIYSLQFGTSKDPRSIALLEVIYTIISSRMFDQLRTKEQLSYVVRTSFSKSNALLSFYFLLQSLRDPFYLEQRINAFLYRFAAFLDNITDDEFDGYVRSLITLDQPRHKSLFRESVGYLNIILTGFYDFDLSQRVAEVLNSLKKEEVIEFFYNYMYPNSTNRKKLSFHLRSQTLESVSVRDLSPRRLQYYFKCQGLDISSDEIHSIIETTPLLEDFEKEILEFFTKKYPNNKDVPSLVSYAFKYLKELYGKLKENAIKDYGALHFTDVTTFKNSLKLSPAPLPVMKWEDYRF